MSKAERVCIGVMGAFLACTMWGHRNPFLAYQTLPSHFSFLVQAPALFFLFVIVVVVFERLLKGTPTLWEDHVFTGGKPQ